MAGLSARAVRDGDEWVVNGQKVWTTLAHVSRWGMLVVRTDPDVPKHKGLSYFIVDMESPGVEVRPLFQITGEAEFNEVYFTDVRVPDWNRLGEVGEGWRIALTTLMNERVAIGSNVTPRGGGAIADAVAVWKSKDRDDLVKRDKLTMLWIEAEAMRLTNIRASDNRRRGRSWTGGIDGQSCIGPTSTRRSPNSRWSCSAPKAFCSQVATRWPDPRKQGWGARPASARSSVPEPTRSKGGPPRSCATSSANGCWACQANHGSTRTFHGKRYLADRHELVRNLGMRSTHRAFRRA